MVMAAVLFAILIGNFLSGSILPTFSCPALAPNGSCLVRSIADFAKYSTPATAADWAKLAVWSFAAGFLERLVPDVLTRIAATAEVKKSDTLGGRDDLDDVLVGRVATRDQPLGERHGERRVRSAAPPNQRELPAQVEVRDGDGGDRAAGRPAIRRPAR